MPPTPHAWTLHNTRRTSYVTGSPSPPPGPPILPTVPPCCTAAHAVITACPQYPGYVFHIGLTSPLNTLGAYYSSSTANTVCEENPLCVAFTADGM